MILFYYNEVVGQQVAGENAGILEPVAEAPDGLLHGLIKPLPLKVLFQSLRRLMVFILQQLADVGDSQRGLYRSVKPGQVPPYGICLALLYQLTNGALLVCFQFLDVIINPALAKKLFHKRLAMIACVNVFRAQDFQTQ